LRGLDERPKWSKERRKPSARSSGPPEPGAVGGDRLAGLGGGELGRGAVLVGGADEHHLVAAGAREAGVDVGRQLGADEVAQCLTPLM
jgi:hypothetical protein